VRVDRARFAAIERALAAVPGVAGAHVGLRGDPEVLVAWVAPARGAALTQTTLRQAVAPALPAAWRPRLVVLVDKLPAGAGAVVERDLRDPFAAGAARRFEPPAEGLERLLADVWGEVLGTGGIGANDNFFELGGTSLSALKVIAEIEKRAGWQFSPRLLFFQNLRQIAQAGPK
jgi:acyl carrier protein